MKLFYNIIIFLIITFLIAGCTNSINPVGQSKPAVTSPTGQPQNIGKIDFSKCLHNSNPQNINSCIIAYYGLQLKSIAVCDQLFESSFNKEQGNALTDKFTCYTEVASITENPEICKQINETNEQSNCYSIIADLKKGVSICNDTSRYDSSGSIQYQMDQCYKDFALHTSNVSICDKIENDQNQMSQCYYEVAIYAYNISICEKISDVKNDAHALNAPKYYMPGIKVMCIDDLAAKFNDSSICNNLLSDEVKKQCDLDYSYVGI